MSLKKDENKTINFKMFKIFIKTKKQYIKLWHPKKEDKVLLIFILIKIALEIDTKFDKLKSDYLKKVYRSWYCGDCSYKHAVEMLEQTIRNKDIVITKPFNVSHFYNSLFSFYENSKIINFFWKKKKIKSIFIDSDGVNNYILLNKNLKYILSFIKYISPEKFNSIYKKILILS